jgi:hypothetical protein
MTYTLTMSMLSGLEVRRSPTWRTPHDILGKTYLVGQAAKVNTF